MRLLLTRPEPDSLALAARLNADGHETLVEPMLRIEFLPGAELPLLEAQAVLLTSANGARALAARTVRRDLRLLCVGAATAAAARDAGFADIASADGDVAALAALAADRLSPADGPLLHVAGSEVAGDLAGDLRARGFQLRRAVLYRAVAAERLSPRCRQALDGHEIDAALFFSPRTAQAFVRLTAAEGLDETLQHVRALCLSAAVAEAAGSRWGAKRVAAAPRQDALLALLNDGT